MGNNTKIEYFKNVKTFDELKKEYRNLMKKYHPDLNPGKEAECTEITKKINAEFEYLFNVLPNTRVNKDGERYEAHKEFETPEEFMNIINKLTKCKDIQIDIIGAWLWVSGETKPIKELLKELKFRWHDVRKCWYYKNTSRKSTLSNLNFDELLDIYGGQRYNFNSNNSDDEPQEIKKLSLAVSY